MRMEIIVNINRLLGHDLKEPVEPGFELKGATLWFMASISIRTKP